MNVEAPAQGRGGGEIVNIPSRLIVKVTRRPVAMSTLSYAPEGACGYDLDERLNTLEQPLIGVSMTVTAGVDYALRRTGDAAPLFQTSVTQPYTAEFNSAFIGAVRLRIANEGAIRTNIETMLRELSASDAAEPSEAPTADGDPTS